MDEVKGRRISIFFINLILHIPPGSRFHLAVLKMSLDHVSIQNMGRQS